MKFAVSTILLASALSAVMAQESSSSATSSSSVSSSSSAAPSSSQESSSAGGAGGAAATSAPVATCTLVSGDPRSQAFGCPEGAVTSTPPYNSESLQSFLIGQYSAGKEGVAISDVAEDLADSVTELYPTLTIPYEAILSQYVSAVSQSATNYVPDAAPASLHVPAALGSIVVAAAAVVVGGAFML